MTKQQSTQMAQNQEIEIKFALAPSAIKKFKNDQFFNGLKEETVQLLNVYYDTPDLDLRRTKIAVRLRRKDWQWQITVKTEGTISGSFSIRGEWNASIGLSSPLAPDSLAANDFSFVSDDALRKFLEKHQQKLQPVFNNHFTRTTWEYADRNGQMAEISLDQGAINVGNHKEPISEVEIELLKGSPDMLFKLSQDLQSRHPLHPLQASKSERGYCLLSDIGNPLNEEWAFTAGTQLPATQYFVSLAHYSLEYLQRHENAIKNADPDLRLTLRGHEALLNLYDCIDFFSELLPDKFLKKYRARWKKLIGATNKIRLWNSYAHDYLPQLLGHFPKTRAHFILTPYIVQHLAHVQQEASNVFKSDDYSRLVLEYMADIWRFSETEEAKKGPSMADFAQKQLRQMLELFKNEFAVPNEADVDDWQQMHERCRSLLGMIKLFSFSIGEQPRKAIQQKLGLLEKQTCELHDIESFPVLFNDLPQKIYNYSYLGQWQADRDSEILAEMRTTVDEFQKIKLP